MRDGSREVAAMVTRIRDRPLMAVVGSSGAPRVVCASAKRCDSVEMKTMLLVALAACAGPSQQQLANTPTATTRRPTPVAPPASDNDKDRYQMDQQLQDSKDAAQAHREASHPESAPPVAPAKPPAKRGPAVQAPEPLPPSR